MRDITILEPKSKEEYDTSVSTSGHRRIGFDGLRKLEDVFKWYANGWAESLCHRPFLVDIE